MKNDTPVGASSCGGSFDIAASFLGVYCCTDCNPAYYIKQVDLWHPISRLIMGQEILEIISCMPMPQAMYVS